MAGEKWSKEQTIVAFNLYCKIPFNKVTSSHPEIQRISIILGRSPSSLSMKMGNFGSFDPELKKRGIVGLTNASKLDKEVWDEFNSNWAELAYQSELLIAEFSHKGIEEMTHIDFSDMPIGKERESIVKTRVNQNFFRTAILSSYNNSCCITGLNIQELLIASHIKPWSIDKENRLNPRNGICLNPLHDKAFDRGYITITQDYRVKVSELIGLEIGNESLKKFFTDFDNIKITLPDKFTPDLSFLDFHSRNIFKY